MKIYIIIILFFSFLVTSACDQKSSPDKAKERASAEGEAQKEVENKNQAQKAMGMESELANRHIFYSALEGEYEGKIKIGNDNFNIKMIFARSILPYTGTRVRQLSEIELDLNNLFFYTKIVQWHPSDQTTAVGCQINGSRPNMDLGNMTLSSNDCSNFYQISFSEDGIFDEKLNSEKSKNLSLKIKNNQLTNIPFLFGIIQPSNNAIKYSFIAKRVK